MIIEDAEETYVYDVKEYWRGRTRYVEFTVDVPEDLYDGAMDEADQRFDFAIRLADGPGGLEDWVRPCNWEKIFDRGDQIRVARLSEV